MKYAVVLPTLNGLSGGVLAAALDSLFNQTMPPTQVCVVDGGSTDGTIQFLAEYAREIPSPNYRFLVNDLPDKHAIVIVHHYNEALAALGTNYDYWFFVADDTIYPASYVEELVKRMQCDRVDIASGDWGLSSPIDRKKAPQGAGRLVSKRMMAKFSYRFPEIYGYESAILHYAEFLGYRTRCYPDIRFTLTNPLGMEAWHPAPQDTQDSVPGHMFYEWGKAMRCLAYHPLYVLFRLLSDLLWNRHVPKAAALKMAWEYFASYWQKIDDPYFRLMNDVAYQKFMRQRQLSRIGHAITFPLRKLGV